MKVTLMKLDYGDPGDELPVIVAEQFADSVPQVYGADDIALTLEYLSDNNSLTDEEITALQIAAQFLRDADFLLGMSQVSRLVVGEYEKMDEA